MFWVMTFAAFAASEPESGPEIQTPWGPLPHVIVQNFCLAETSFKGKVLSSEGFWIYTAPSFKELYVDVKFKVQIPFSGTSVGDIETVTLPAMYLHPLMRTPGQEFVVALDDVPGSLPPNFIDGQRFVSTLELFPEVLSSLSEAYLKKKAKGLCYNFL